MIGLPTPRPIIARPPERAWSEAKLIAVITGVRVWIATTAVPSCTREVTVAYVANTVSASAPLTSAVHKER